MSYAHSQTRSEAIPENTPFADYHAEFNDVVTSVQTGISSAQTQVRTDATRATDTLANTQRLLEEASDLLNSMELEMQTLDSRSRQAVRPLVATARDGLSRLRGAARATRADIDACEDGLARVSLLADGGGNRDRDRLADSTADLEAASHSLVDSRRNISETEAVGSSILQDLQQQRATIVRARNNLGAVDSGLDHSSSILSSMNRRAVLNRIVVYIVGAAIAVACVAVLYVRLFHPRRQV